MYADDRERLDKANQFSLSIGVGQNGKLYCITYHRKRQRMIPDYQEVTGVTPYMDQLALCNNDFVFVLRD